MTELVYTIKDNSGIHARPAGLLVKKAQQFASDITITKGEKTVDLKKLFALMSLAIKKDETVTITADGSDEAQAIEAVKELMETEGL